MNKRLIECENNIKQLTQYFTEQLTNLENEMKLNTINSIKEINLNKSQNKKDKDEIKQRSNNDSIDQSNML